MGIVVVGSSRGNNSFVVIQVSVIINPG